MPWVRLDDRFAEHPKVMAAGPLAMAMHVAALCYCNRNMTDGLVPAAVIDRLIDVDSSTASAVVRRLEKAGMWEAAKGGGFTIHDYADFQPTRVKRKELSAVRADAGRKGAQARWSRDSKPPLDIDNVIASCHRTLAARFDDQDIQPALVELRNRLETGESITSPVNFAANGAEAHRRERMAAIKRSADEKAARLEADKAAGLDTCEHGEVRRDCAACREAARKAAEEALATAKSVLAGGS